MSNLHLALCVIISTSIYLFLHIKTRISLKFIFIDNIGVSILSYVIPSLIMDNKFYPFIFSIVLILMLIFLFTMIRFWRTPRRKIKANENQIISPADGKIIYIKKVRKNEVPISIKNKSISSLTELTKTELLNYPCWLIGINMTPFDVHKNCAPIDGIIILNKHYYGKFLSLKSKESIVENERNTYVIKNENLVVGVIQIASKRVRRIDSYVKEGEFVKKGQWLGMIRFGSQVDIIIPDYYDINVDEGQQVYAISTIIATKKE